MPVVFKSRMYDGAARRTTRFLYLIDGNVMELNKGRYYDTLCKKNSQAVAKETGNIVNMTCSCNGTSVQQMEGHRQLHVAFPMGAPVVDQSQHRQ